MRFASSQAVSQVPLLPWQWHNLLVSGEESYGVILLSAALCLCWSVWRFPKLYLWQCNKSGESSWSGDQQTQNKPCPCHWTPSLATSKLLTGHCPSLCWLPTLHASCSVEHQATWPKPCQVLGNLRTQTNISQCSRTFPDTVELCNRAWNVQKGLAVSNPLTFIPPWSVYGVFKDLFPGCVS